VTGTTRLLGIGAVHGSYIPPRRSVLVRFEGCRNAPGEVKCKGTKLPRVDHIAGVQEWAYDAKEESVIVSIPDSREAVEVLVQQ
jgi:hypothetical protein